MFSKLSGDDEVTFREFVTEVCEAGDRVLMAEDEPTEAEAIGDFFAALLKGAGASILGAGIGMVGGAKGEASLKLFNLSLDISFDSNGTPMWRFSSNRNGGGLFGDDNYRREDVHSTEGLASLVGAALAVGEAVKLTDEAKAAEENRVQEMRERQREAMMEKVTASIREAILSGAQADDGDDVPFATLPNVNVVE